MDQTHLIIMSNLIIHTHLSVLGNWVVSKFTNSVSLLLGRDLDYSHSTIRRTKDFLSFYSKLHQRLFEIDIVESILSFTCNIHSTHRKFFFFFFSRSSGWRFWQLQAPLLWIYNACIIFKSWKKKIQNNVVLLDD